MDENKPDFCTDEQLEDYLIYLDALRKSGATNMFGAGAYLRKEFELDSDEASCVLTYWMRTFSERHPQ